MLPCERFSNPPLALPSRVKGVFTAFLKGLLRSVSPISFPVTTFRLLVGFSSSSKFKRIGDTFHCPLCSCGSDLSAERCPSISSLMEGAVSVRRISTLTLRGSPKVDPMTPTGVGPILSPEVPLSSPPVILVLR
ncbi:hypothetical protein Tco_0516781 [Tanacetum coccineum]